jgi:hypothetical protein
VVAASASLPLPLLPRSVLAAAVLAVLAVVVVVVAVLQAPHGSDRGQ